MRVVAAMIAIGMVLVACGNDPAADLPVAAASPVEASPTGEPSPVSYTHLTLPTIYSV